MKKNIIFGTGIVVTLTTLVFLLIGKLELSTFGTINSVVLSILFGWYQKITKDDLNLEHVDTVTSLIDYNERKKNEMQKQLLDTVKSKDEKLKTCYETIDNLKAKLEASVVVIPKLQEMVEECTFVETDKSKPKRKRNIKK